MKSARKEYEARLAGPEAESVWQPGEWEAHEEFYQQDLDELRVIAEDVADAVIEGAPPPGFLDALVEIIRAERATWPRRPDDTGGLPVLRPSKALIEADKKLAQACALVAREFSYLAATFDARAGVQAVAVERAVRSMGRHAAACATKAEASLSGRRVDKGFDLVRSLMELFGKYALPAGATAVKSGDKFASDYRGELVLACSILTGIPTKDCSWVLRARRKLRPEDESS